MSTQVSWWQREVNIHRAKNLLATLEARSQVGSKMMRVLKECGVRKLPVWMWFMLLFCAICPTLSEALNSEGLALLAFKIGLQDPDGALSDWNATDIAPCKWRGIICHNFTNNVTKINLPGLNLGGIISPRIGRLTQLTRLNLHSNKLTGAIPSSIGLLVNLTDLDLSNNQLQGEIPETLKELTKLAFLNISCNNLEGYVPEGVLASSGSASFDNNDQLCGRPRGRTSCERFRSLVQITNSSGSGVAAGAGTGSGTKRAGLSVGVILAICVSAFVATKVFLGTLCYIRWTKIHSTCEIKLSGGKMVMFQLSGKATPSSKAVLRKIEKLKQQDIVGSGGYGTVYKLVLDDTTAFAVKKLARGGKERERGFERELETLADIKHRNLVTLRGYYSAPHINILVYDFLINGNLETLLHGLTLDHADYARRNEKPINWETRLNIALGSARGLNYLHHDCIPHIIHRDIKASNILLDEDMEAHVSDFGLAKLINPLETHVTTIMAGTLGYFPPEYMDTGKVTEKGDVFSFGIVLLELLTGKRPGDDVFSDNNFSMVQWAETLLAAGQPEDIFDEYILGTCPDEELLTALDITLQCVNPLPTLRPTMLQVVKMLAWMRGDNAGWTSGSSYFGVSGFLTKSGSEEVVTSNSISSQTSGAHTPVPNCKEIAPTSENSITGPSAHRSLRSTQLAQDR